MTDATTKSKQPPGTALERLLAVAQSPEERARAYVMADRMAQERVIFELLREAKLKAWGAGVSPVLQAGIIRWALYVGADPMTEVDVLGGNPYLNVRYWQRLTAADPTFLRAKEQWVHDDVRADDETRAQRRALRVEYAIPDEIAATVGVHRERRDAAAKLPPIKILAACIVTLYFKDRGPFIGKKWCPSRAVDDVGMDYPELTAFSRAWRRAALQGVRRENPFAAQLKRLIAEHRAGDPDTGDADTKALQPQETERIEPVRGQVDELRPAGSIEGVWESPTPPEGAAPAPPSAPAPSVPPKKGDLF